MAHLVIACCLMINPNGVTLLDIDAPNKVNPFVWLFYINMVQNFSIVILH